MTAPRRKSVVAAASLALLCAACATHEPMPSLVALAPDAAPADVAVAVAPTPRAIPTSWTAGVPIVEATIDGRGPLHVLLDSGTSMPILHRRVADAWKLEIVEIGDGGQRVDAGEGKIAIREAVRFTELRAGPFATRDGGMALVFDLSGFESASGIRIDGILPAAVFRPGLLTIDHARGDATFVEGGLPPADDRTVFDIDSDDRPFATLDVGGGPCRVLIDTGNFGFLSIPSARRDAFRYRAPPVVVGRRMTAAGIFPSEQARVDGSIAWGAARVADPIVTFSEASFGNAGIHFLREFRVTFDFSNRRIRFERRGDEPVRSPPVRGVGAGFLREADAWVVKYVLDGTPAARAGLAVEDRVVGVDGRPASDVGVVEYGDMIDTRSALTFRVVRKLDARDVTLPIVTLVE